MIPSDFGAPLIAQNQRSWSTDDFDYELPQALIAQTPARERTASRLLVLDAPNHPPVIDHRFAGIGDFLLPGDLLVVNNTQVIPARLLGHKRDSGGAVEVLLERMTGTFEATVMLRASKPPAPGVMLSFGGFQAEVIGRADNFFHLRFDTPVEQVLGQVGHVPLPPYITQSDKQADQQRYQTVYAKVPGAVAAPTAGLHFDQNLLAKLRQQNIETAELTLHVGAGTFQPVRVQSVAEHKMHFERYEIGEQAAHQINEAKRSGRRIVAVGTTSMRTLESVAQGNGSVKAASGETDLFITPGYRFRCVDALITNFHLPRSTLMMLVSAFAGVDRIRVAYSHAVAQRYRFFSYGDAMLLHRQGTDHA
jgi:S-adenosylmethionine:tRNA ribosyltransferase-isomerase